MSSEFVNTQGVEDAVFSQEDPTAALIWGTLFSTRRRFQSLEMVKDEYTVGRHQSCDFVLEKETPGGSGSSQDGSFPKEKIRVEVPSERLSTFSKVHFKIKKEISVVILEDLSSNGTYVNNVLVGKGKTYALQSRDQISLAHPDYKVFIFENFSNNNQPIYPEEVRNNFVVSRSLGKGSFGEVMLVFQKRTCQSSAMKIVSKKSLNSSNDAVMNEVAILKSLKHPCVITIHNAINTDDNVYIFLEYMEGGDLMNRVKTRKRLEEREAKWIFSQITNAVEYLHKKGIAHRDLKLENILLSSDQSKPIAKITDFGLSKFFDSQRALQTMCGTLSYVAPEVLETRGCGAYNNKVDVWSMGVILYVCLSGFMPFNSEREDMNMEEQICSGSYSFPRTIWRGVSNNAIELVKKLMTVNSKLRIEAHKITFEPWFKDEELQRSLMEKNIFRTEVNENEPPLKRQRV